MKNDVFRDVTSCGVWKNRCFGGTYHHDHQGDKEKYTITSRAYIREQLEQQKVKGRPIINPFHSLLIPY
jgi:hypothetical protein